MSDELKDNLSNLDNWLRALMVALFAFVFVVASWVLGFVVLLNLLILLITGSKNPNLARFGDQIARYIGEIMAYGTLSSDQQPFPFGEWPDDISPAAAEAAPKAAPPAAPKQDSDGEKPAAEPVSKPTAPSKKTASKKAASRKKTAKKKATKKTG